LVPPTTVPATTGTTGKTGDVTLSFPTEVEAGAAFDVTWTGEALPDDWVAIVEVGSPATSWLSYFLTRDGSPGELVAPVEDGAYLIRFVEDATGEVLVELPITVTPYEATVEAPDRVEAGAEFEVTWTGPDGPGDYVTIVPVGSAPSFYLDWDYTTAGSPITLTAPDEPGDYEVWYATGGVAVILASQQIIVD
jgi:Ca-activated chloride channel family protein